MPAAKDICHFKHPDGRMIVSSVDDEVSKAVVVHRQLILLLFLSSLVISCHVLYFVDEGKPLLRFHSCV